MASALVEYLLNQYKSNGEPLCYMAGGGGWVAAFPPLTTTTFYLGPQEGEYALLLYKVIYDTANVPMAFSIYAQHAGIRPFEGQVQQIFAQIGVEGWLVLTEAQKLFVRASNVSNLFQRLNYGFWFLLVKTKEDWDILISRIEHYNTSSAGVGISDLNDLIRAIRQPQAVYNVPTPPRR